MLTNFCCCNLLTKQSFANTNYILLIDFYEEVGINTSVITKLNCEIHKKNWSRILNRK